ncbi:flagellar biosynthesis protein FlhB [Collimonas sp.]|jgi:flagellar biosynthetic protein FlhB|uniref:flagellar biosynthesis protein FlhB n=1 Tax=Collimonas sp. TaxID=1963772 RepID=UPI002CA77B2B|nr:flagellar biosynthesis protein FlhB [Collimonas sp.]HWW04623.1 flagellar biosynthesis protein FlhB [Collimonas sp.]
MAEESDLEKTEPGSPRRIEKAREEGQVARSRELSTFVMLTTGIVGLWMTAVPMAEHIGHALRQAMQFKRAAGFDTSYMLTQSAAAAQEALQALLPLLGMLALAALAAPVMLGGWLFSPQSLAPKFSKLNPVAGIARIFSSQSLAELFKACTKSVLVGGIAYWVMSRNLDTLLGLQSEPLHGALAHTVRLVANCCSLIIGSLLLVAAIDVPYQLWSYYRKLRMTREELKQEHKESEGDPHIKGLIRRQQQQMARRRMMADVASADVVVTNPTHFAVALKYSDKEMRAPRVVAKGTDLVALRIRAIGAEHKIPMLEAPPLTRALYRHTNLGEEIPAALYTAVAEVLAWVYQLQRWRSEGGIAPRTPADLPVPDSLDISPDTIGSPA